MPGTRAQAAVDESPPVLAPLPDRPTRAGPGPLLISFLSDERGVVVAAALLALGAFALAGWIIVTDHRDTRRDAEMALGNVAGAVQQDLARNVELYDHTLQATVDALRLPGIDTLGPELRHAALFDRLTATDYMSAVLVLDTGANVVADSNSLVPRHANLADRDYFRALRDDPAAGLFISAVSRERAAGPPLLVLARRVTRDDGSFGGVVVGSVHLEYFYKLFSTLDFGSGGAISLLRTDGMILARFPVRAGQIGRSIAGSLPMRRMLAGGSGLGEEASPFDGVIRLYVYRRVGALPLIVAASYARDAVFAGWQRKTVSILSGISVLVGVAAGLLFVLRQQLGQRAAAERSALESAAVAQQSERALARSLRQLDTVFQHSVDIHFAVSRRDDGQLVFDLINRRAEVIAGRPAAEMLGRTAHECLPAERADLVLSRWEACLRDGNPVVFEQWVDTGGAGSFWETCLVPLVDPAGGADRLIGSTRDITDRKDTETALMDLNTVLERRAAEATAAQDDALARASAAERLQLLGKLSSGIAHDVNNVLQSVAGCAAMIERRAHDPEAMHRVARMIADAAARGGAITRRLLVFSRAEPKPTARAELTPMFDVLLDILRHTLAGAGPLDIRSALAEPGLTVLAPASQLETVLLNLATNARDAMPEGGILTLGAEAAEPPPELGPGEFVRLFVSDTGVGMDAATLARVREPFFTTKPVGEGTGLGLSMADGFARDAGGALVLHSTPGRGTTAELWLRREPR